MNEAIELHDSVLDSLEMQDGVLAVAFRPAYIHRSAGEPGVDDGSGFVQDVIIEFGRAQIEGSPGLLPADVFDGDFELNGVVSPNMIKMPCDPAKEAGITLHLSPDYRRICISGELLGLTTVSEAKYIEEFRR